MIHQSLWLRPIWFLAIVAAGLFCMGAIVFAGPGRDVAGAEKAYVAPPLPVCDPMEWREPTELPKLDDPLGQSEYDQRVAALHLPDSFDVDAAKSRSSQTVAVRTVTRGSAAWDAGMRRGDIIVRLNGQTMHDGWAVGLNITLPEDVTFDILSRGGTKTWRAHLPAGPLGAEMQMYWDVAASWANDADRDEKFDACMMVAARAFDADPELVQAALARAQRGGCHGHALAAAACLNAFDRYEFDSMLECGAIALKTAPPDEVNLFKVRQILAAEATFKLTYALDLANFPGVAPSPVSGFIRDAANAWQKLPERVHRNPLAELDRYPFRDASARIVSLIPPVTDNWATPQAARDLRDNATYTFSAPGGSFRMHILGPSGNNADLKLEFSTAPSDKIVTPFNRAFVFGLVDCRDPGRLLLKINVFDSGRMQVSRYGEGDYALAAPPSFDGHQRARIIVVGQRCEVVFNGKRVFYGPVTPPEKGRRLGMFLQTIGMTSTIHDFSWKIAGAAKE